MKETKNYLYCDYLPLAPITVKTREKNKKNIFTGSIRLSKGMYRTKKEQEKYIDKSIKRKLP